MNLCSAARHTKQIPLVTIGIVWRASSPRRRRLISKPQVTGEVVLRVSLDLASHGTPETVSPFSNLLQYLVRANTARPHMNLGHGFYTKGLDSSFQFAKSAHSYTFVNICGDSDVYSHVTEYAQGN